MMRQSNTSRLRTIFYLVMPVIFLIQPSTSTALSIAAQRPHDINMACAGVKTVVDSINKQAPHDDYAPLSIYTDQFGKVEPAEEVAFLASMHQNEGKNDRRSIRIYGVFRLLEDKFNPTYFVVLERQRWHLKRYEDDGNGGETVFDDPHYETDTSFWLATFQTERVTDFREANELYKHITANKLRIDTCYTD